MGRYPRPIWRSIRPGEQVRIVALVDEREPVPGVALHVEHQRLDLALGLLGGEARSPRATQFGLHLAQIDHGRGLRRLLADTLAQFRLFCKCSCNRLAIMELTN